MFDIATRPVPAGVSAGQVGVPFDWVLGGPAPVRDYPWTEFVTPGGTPLAYVDQLATYGIALEDTLQTAIVQSLFTDARASTSDQLPYGVTELRGWVGDEFMGNQAGDDTWGSLLWLVEVCKQTSDVLPRAKYYAQTALAWMVRDGVASSVVVDALWVPTLGGDRLAIRPQIFRPNNPRPVYDVLWGTTIKKGTSA